MAQTSHAPLRTSPLAHEEGPVAREKESFVEYWLIMPKLLYFMLNMFVYATHSLLPKLFVEHWGFSRADYGLVTSLYVCSFLGSLFWTHYANRTGKYRAVVIMTSLAYAAVNCLMMYFKADNRWKQAAIIVGFAATNFLLSAVFPLVDAQILGSLSKNPKFSKDQFNKQRMWSAVGHFAATMLSFCIKNRHASTDFRPTIIYQIVVTGIFVVCVWFGLEDVSPARRKHQGAPAGDKSQPAEKSKEGDVHQVPVADAPTVPLTPAPAAALDELTAEGTQGGRHPAAVLFASPSFMFFMLFVTCSGVIRAITSAFQKPLATDASKQCPFFYEDWKMTQPKPWTEEERKFWGDVNAGAIDFGRMIPEMLVYLGAKRLIAYWGVYWVLVSSQFVGIARALGYGLIDLSKPSAYYYTWIFEILKGFSSGLVSSSAIPIASRLAPAGCEDAAQGFFSGNYSGLSMALGGILAGGILRLLQGDGTHAVRDTQQMYLYVGFACLLVTIVMAIKFTFLDRVMGLPGYPRKHSLPS